MLFLGIDTSNYTTSTAIFESEGAAVFQEKLPLPVSAGSVGLRQSDAVFHHTRQLPTVMERLFAGREAPSAIGVSSRPRSADDSYMPCFLAGEGLAKSLSAVLKIPIFSTSHQVGHVLAALYSAEKQELVHEKFIAFHVSGGTTDCLLVEPSESEILTITQLASSLDLKAGQAVDRVGVSLGLAFPCGTELERLAARSAKGYSGIKPVLKGADCCLSGLENKCLKLLVDGEEPCDIAKYCLSYIAETLAAMTAKIKSMREYANLPLVFAGGVMSNQQIKGRILQEFEASFAAPEFSSDNAAGVAIFASLMAGRN